MDIETDVRSDDSADDAVISRAPAEPPASTASPPTPPEWLAPRPLVKQSFKPALRCLADLPDQPVAWVWPGRIARGALTLLCGDAGLGKSLLTLDMAARVTRGMIWPDGRTAAEPGSVLLLCGEDSIGGAVRTRLLNHGADLRKIFYLKAGEWRRNAAPTSEIEDARPSSSPDEPLIATIVGPSPHGFRAPDAKTGPQMASVAPGRGVRDLAHDAAQCSVYHYTPFGFQPAPVSRSLARDAYGLTAALESLPDCRLVIIDPITAYLHAASLDDHADVRSQLTPLVTLAERSNAAIVAVAHRDEAAAEGRWRRPNPLKAIAAMARTSYLVAPSPDDAARRVFVPAKNNLAEQGAGLEYRTADCPQGGPLIAWSKAPATLTAADLLEPLADQPSKRLSYAERVRTWLSLELADGPVPSKELTQRALRAGFTERALDRARASLGVTAVRENTLHGRWICVAPGQESHASREGRQDSSLAALAPLASLAPLSPRPARLA